MAVLHTFNLYNIVMYFKNRKTDMCSFVLLKIILIIPRKLWFCMNFRVVYSVFIKTAVEYMMFNLNFFLGNIV